MKRLALVLLLIVTGCTSGASEFIQEPFGEPYGAVFSFSVSHGLFGYSASDMDVLSVPYGIALAEPTEASPRAVVHYLNGSSSVYAGEMSFCPDYTDVCSKVDALSRFSSGTARYTVRVTPDTTHITFFVQGQQVHSYVRSPSEMEVRDISLRNTSDGYVLSWRLTGWTDEASLGVRYGDASAGWESLLSVHDDWSSGTEHLRVENGTYYLNITAENFRTSQEVVDVRFSYGDGSQQDVVVLEDFLPQLLPTDFEVFLDPIDEVIYVGNGVLFGVDRVEDPLTGQFPSGSGPFNVTWSSARFPIPPSQVHDDQIVLGGGGFWDQPITPGPYTITVSLVHSEYPRISKQMNMSFELRE